MILKRFKFLPWFLLIIFIFLQCRLWFETGGIIDMLKLKRAFVLQKEENKKLSLRNEKLIEEVNYLQTHKEAVLPIARNELGMIQKGETFYQVINKTSSASTKAEK